MLEALGIQPGRTAGMRRAGWRLPFVLVGSVVLVLIDPGRVRAQDVVHRGDVVVSFGPQVLSWQELRAEMLLAPGGDVPLRVEQPGAKLTKEGHNRVPAPAAGPSGKTMAAAPSGKVRTISRL